MFICKCNNNHIPNDRGWSSFGMKEAAISTRGQISLFVLNLFWAWRTTKLSSPVSSLWGKNSSLSLSVSSTAKSETHNRHDDAFRAPITCNLSFVLWYTNASSPSSWSIYHSSIHRPCSPLLTILVSYVQITIQIIFNVCWFECVYVFEYNLIKQFSWLANTWMSTLDPSVSLCSSDAGGSTPCSH